jgi:ABC-type cobalamin/Fe3+-siderophores transport system ATPase subunit
MSKDMFAFEDELAGTEEKEPLVLSRLVILGFWGSRKVAIEFDKDANFVIGPNGCGKTTIVNLLAACLSVDFVTIDRIDFSEVSIELSEKNSNRVAARVNVTKTVQKNLPFPRISYAISDSRTGMNIEVQLDDVEEQLALRDMRYINRRRTHKSNLFLTEELRKLCNVTWLSVHRSDAGREKEERAYDSLVDLKLDHQANALVRYFSRLDQRTAEALRDFQQTLFLSLLTDDDSDRWFFDYHDYDVDKEKEALLAIFEQFNVQKSKYVSRVDRHFGRVKRAIGSDEAMAIDVISALVNQKKIHEIVGEWNKFQAIRRDIYKLRTSFVDCMNRMLLGKEVYISKANEVSIRAGGRGLSVKALSSGEKQLMIILGEALLQEGSPVIYIADEPELSLHVGWQEMLVSNIREINSNAQIVFATHSPDIVGSYSDFVIDAKRVIS